MKIWVHSQIVANLTRSAIQEAVKDPEWQKFRRSLKGIPTEEKLSKLSNYFLISMSLYEGKEFEKCKTRVMNYINALKRGGQLDTKGRVVR